MMKKQPLSAPSDVRRYFVSPIESGQLCMLACLLGASGDIFFPKLRENQMMTFSDIAEEYLAKIGLKPDYCATEEEARQKAINWNETNKTYPVYFFKTDTSGEKFYEEFYAETDNVLMNLYSALGIVKNDTIASEMEIKANLKELSALFAMDHIQKGDVIKLLNQFLPDFQHVETGKNLDQKM